MQFKTASCYKYCKLGNLESLRDDIRETCKSLNILGRILISKEGINAAFSGKISDVEKFKVYLGMKFENISFRERTCGKNAYHKLVVRIRKEIVHFSAKVDLRKKGKYITPSQLKRLFDLNEDFVMLDARNDYETKIGKFRNAITLPIEMFREFPRAVEGMNGMKGKKVIAYCTGGIRCEKATAFLRSKGFKDVYQLRGGIIEFINQFPNTYFDGSCFVFDDKLVEHGSKPISKCELCSNDCDGYMNCHNLDCDKLFVCCDDCKIRMNKTCSIECKNAPRQRKNDFNRAS